MDNLQIPPYSFIEWTKLPKNPFTILNKDAIFRATYNATGETMIYAGCVDNKITVGLRIGMSTGGGMLLSNLSNVEYVLLDHIHPYPPVNESDPFTKLEKASLMIAQGMLSADQTCALSPDIVSTESVRYAKAVLEEANK